MTGRVGLAPSHFAECSQGQKLLTSMLKGSPVSACQIARFMKENRKDERSLTKSLTFLNIENTATDWKGIQTLLQNFLHLHRLEADEPHWQNLLVNLGEEGPACRHG